MASVIHGFIYNKDAFDKLGLKPPATVDQFLRRSTRSRPTHLYVARPGTKDAGDGLHGYQNIGPTTKGEEGRKR